MPEGFPGSLETALTIVWQLDEASGAAIDEIASINLSDNNTVGSESGVFGGARVFTAANSEYLSIASNPSLEMGDIDFTFSCWFKLNSQPAMSSEFDLISKYETATSEREYRLHYINVSGTYSLRWTLCANGACSVFAAPTITGELTTDVWHHCCCWHDAVNDVAGLQLNGGVPTTVFHSGGVFAAESPFHLGSLGRSATTFFFDGSLDRVALWKRVLTSQERDIISNPSGPPLGIDPAINHYLRQMMGSH